jgi:molecular chaperone HscB
VTDAAAASRSAFDMNLQSTDFELFEVAQQFAQDSALLDARWKALQNQAHPDKFAAHGASAQRLAMQWSVRINEAYQRLKDPLKRAAYLCELRGAPINAEKNTAMPADFLMQQMQLRETLEEAASTEDLDEIGLQTNRYMREQLSKVEQLLDTENEPQQAAQAVRALMFIERLVQDIESRYEVLES